MPIVSPSTNNLPKDIHQALSAKPNVIQSTIIQALEQRPKYSSVRRNIPGYVLKLWNIRTSGNPRANFLKLVDKQITIMSRKEILKVYNTNTNVRVKLNQMPLKLEG